MLEYVVEALGTFLFLSTILAVVKEKSAIAPLIIGFVLTAMIAWGGRVSGGHFNPAVSFMLFLNKTISAEVLSGFVLSQLLGATLAWQFVELSTNS